MTVLIGIVEDDVMYLGADSIAANSDYKTIRRDSKIFKKGEMLIACTHSFRFRDLIKYQFNLPKHPKGMSVEKYIVTKFVKDLRKLLKENGHIGKDDEGEAGCGLLLAYRGKILNIETDFQCGQDKMNFDAYGKGEFAAKASLYSTSFYDIDPITRMKLAFESCRKYVNGCCEPPYIIKKLKVER